MSDRIIRWGIEFFLVLFGTAFICWALLRALPLAMQLEPQHGIPLLFGIAFIVQLIVLRISRCVAQLLEEEFAP